MGKEKLSQPLNCIPTNLPQSIMVVNMRIPGFLRAGKLQVDGAATIDKDTNFENKQHCRTHTVTYIHVAYSYSQKESRLPLLLAVPSTVAAFPS